MHIDLLNACYIPHIKHWSSLPNGLAWQLHKGEKGLFTQAAVISVVHCYAILWFLANGGIAFCGPFVVSMGIWLLVVAIELKIGVILVTFGLGLFFFFFFCTVAGNIYDDSWSARCISWVSTISRYFFLASPWCRLWTMNEKWTFSTLSHGYFLPFSQI